jgi:hypothetical protein
MDFDVPDADNDRLRALEAPINDLIRQDIPLSFVYLRCTRRRRHPACCQPLGHATTHAGRQGPHRRDCRPRPPGLRRHASRLDRRLAADPHPQDRQQGPHNRRIRIGWPIDSAAE